MTTIRQIIIDALREGGILAVGASPDNDEYAEALRRIQPVIKSLIGNELGEELRDISYGTSGLTNPYGIAADMSNQIQSLYVPNNTRLIFNNSATQTLFLTPNPRDGSRFGVVDNASNLATYPVTINANGRRIETATTLNLATNGMTREWFYRADTGNWARVTDLVGEDPSPFPSEFDDFLVISLAIRLNPRYGVATSPESIDVLRKVRSQFRARYHQTHQESSEEGLYRLTLNSYPGDYSSTTDFTTGTP
jgi:hypothetical protein